MALPIILPEPTATAGPVTVDGRNFEIPKGSRLYSTGHGTWCLYPDSSVRLLTSEGEWAAPDDFARDVRRDLFGTDEPRPINPLAPRRGFGSYSGEEG